MKVKELITLLEEQNPEAEVMIDYDYIDGDPGWTSHEEEEHEIASIYSSFNEIHFTTYEETLWNSEKIIWEKDF